jgi:hypothetical protein
MIYNLSEVNQLTQVVDDAGQIKIRKAARIAAQKMGIPVASAFPFAHAGLIIRFSNGTSVVVEKFGNWICSGVTIPTDCWDSEDDQINKIALAIELVATYKSIGGFSIKTPDAYAKTCNLLSYWLRNQ